jgi:very-short-patch-repair endonuclease
MPAAGGERGVPAVGGERARAREHALAELACAQHGVVAARQLKQLGFTVRQIRTRRENLWLHPVHRGVYAVGHRRLSIHGRWMAAVLACGADSLLSHRDAAALWDLRPVPPGATHVTVAACARRSQRGIVVHAARELSAADRAVVDGIPVTAIPRTLLDLATVLPFQHLRLLLEAAERRDLLDGQALADALARYRGHHGACALRRAVAESFQDGRDPPWTQSSEERRLLAACRAAGLPEPRCNVFVCGFLVDMYWEEQGVVVEIDGWAFHKTRARFEEDRRKRDALAAAGLVVLTPTPQRIRRELEAVVLQITQVLRLRGLGQPSREPSPLDP